ncbi:MAG: hypothetical protein JJ896_09705 [Rhodothermales bacterium]|nr:hypothetical protein [Rhodothermales bacterium]MBO6779914.1 hypothetical protein [Rhodothermales bacterium]
MRTFLMILAISLLGCDSVVDALEDEPPSEVEITPSQITAFVSFSASESGPGFALVGLASAIAGVELRVEGREMEDLPGCTGEGCGAMQFLAPLDVVPGNVYRFELELPGGTIYGFSAAAADIDIRDVDQLTEHSLSSDLGISYTSGASQIVWTATKGLGAPGASGLCGDGLCTIGSADLQQAFDAGDLITVDLMVSEFGPLGEGFTAESQVGTIYTVSRTVKLTS